MTYEEFLARKAHSMYGDGFDVVAPDWLFGFQKGLVEWAVRMGRAAIFADCGLGKTPMQLAWADAVAAKCNGRVLIVTPLAVGPQTVREGQKFGIEAVRSVDGRGLGRITVTNYERLQHCDHMTFFPSHSFEQYYQGVRRCWRFGQRRPVTVDMVTSEGEVGVVRNLERKARQADEQFAALVAHMNRPLSAGIAAARTEGMEVPQWL